MATMGSYCKAYPIENFRAFEKWSEKPVEKPTEKQEAAEDTATAETSEENRYLFLQENLVVTDGIFLDENIVYDNVTPEWETFCREQLHFEVPDFKREHEERLAKKRAEEAIAN